LYLRYVELQVSTRPFILRRPCAGWSKEVVGLLARQTNRPLFGWRYWTFRGGHEDILITAYDIQWVYGTIKSIPGSTARLCWYIDKEMVAGMWSGRDKSIFTVD